MNLTAERLNRGMSVRQAAERIGIAAGTLSTLEAGGSVHPASAKLVADFYGCKVTDLLPVTSSEAA
jgi:transcriptional regulator with XRE-family HTH domain